MNNKKERNEAYNANRQALQKHINSFPLNIDRSCFRKTEEEKVKLKIAKYICKNNVNNN